MLSYLCECMCQKIVSKHSHLVIQFILSFEQQVQGFDHKKTIHRMKKYKNHNEHNALV